MKTLINIILISLIGIFSNISMASSTGGLVWIIPSDYFKNVDKMGMVNLNERWAWIQMDKWRFPLYAVFSTGYKGESNILGKHWRIPLFESKAFPRDEKTYTVYMPEGRILTFYKSNKFENIYRCTDVWTGVSDKGMFVVKSIYGVELTFKNGRLHRMRAPEKYGDYDLFFKYQKSQFIELRNKSNVIIKCAYEKEGGATLEFPKMKEEIAINAEETKDDTGTIKKIITLSSKNAVSGSYEILLREKGDSSIKSIPPNNRGNPKLITWDSESGYIKTDDDLKYTITPPVGRGWYAKIERVGKDGQRESWYRDNWNGVETILRSDGVTIERGWFTTGKLRRLDRYQKVSRDQYSTKTEFFYDENRKLIREVKDNVESDYVYEPDGKLGAIIRDGKLTWSTPYGATLAQQYIKTEDSKK